MSKPRTAVPRYRDQTGPVLLAQGFRPFFLLAGVWAILALVLSLATMLAGFPLPTAAAATSWHFHEMLFGYVAAVIAGFLLTAIPNWTGRLPLQGAPLLGLVGLWLAGRLAMSVSLLIGPWTAALIDLAFLAALAAVTLREIAAGRNWRNAPVVAILVLLLLCNALFHAEQVGLAETEGLARRGAIGLVVMLIVLIGGRVVPSFTRNWLAKRGAERLPAAVGLFDKVTLGVTLAALICWAVAPGHVATGASAGLAAALNLARLLRWRGQATLAEPLLWVLHLGYLWVPLGLALLALGFWGPELRQSGALHALTAGAMGTMTLAMMSRATLGHTGAALTAGPALTAAYALVALAALARVAATLWLALSPPLLAGAALAWIAAFLLYLGVCGPRLVTRQTR